jgi:RHS repeat-associated protein
MFTGEPLDANGLVYLRARYYVPELGVFPSLDPVEGTARQPMSLNRYGYVAGNVVNAVDPSGRIMESPERWASCKPQYQQDICPRGSSPVYWEPPKRYAYLGTPMEKRLIRGLCRVDDNSMLFVPGTSITYTFADCPPGWERGVGKLCEEEEAPPGSHLPPLRPFHALYPQVAWIESGITPPNQGPGCAENIQAVLNELSGHPDPRVKTRGIIWGLSGPLPILPYYIPTVGGVAVAIVHESPSWSNLDAPCSGFFAREIGVGLGLDLSEGHFVGLVMSTAPLTDWPGISINVSGDIAAINAGISVNPSCNVTAFFAGQIPGGFPTASLTVGYTGQPGSCSEWFTDDVKDTREQLANLMIYGTYSFIA